MSMWRIELLGGLTATGEERCISRFRTRKTASLLAYLAYYHRRAHPREELIELLWPERSPDAGRDSLSTALASLRRQLEPPGTPAGAVITADRLYVRINPATCAIDVAQFETGLRAARQAGTDTEKAQLLAQVIDLYRGELLPGFFEDWIVGERLRLGETYLQALEQLVTLTEQAGDLTSALGWARRVVIADPLREEAQQALMRLLAASGWPEAAMRQDQMLEVLRRTAGDAAPTDEARSLYRELAQRGGAKAAAGESPGATSLTAPRLPPTALPGPEARLPLWMTRFFGCERELEGLRTLLTRADVRLVTLTGPGGSGKTRLAVEAASQLRETFHHAVSFVPLADLVEPSQIAAKVLDVLRLPGSPDLDPTEQLVATLSRQPCLLLLDNFEHLVSGGADWVNTLLEQAPVVTVLVTSRQRLGLTGEREFPVPLLASPGEPDTPERLLEYESVRLFTDRAQMALPDFQITAANAAAIAALCRRLEGLPLALELAAARVPVLAPAQILARLSDRFELLTTRKRDVLPRHRSLRLALDWSFQLLAPELQRFFTRLSVFRGRWNLDAAEAVCEEPLALEYLTQLREGSLLVAEESGEEMRFRLLETLREFGAEQLAPAAQADLERRHARYFLALAEAAEPHLRGNEQGHWMERLSRDYENLRVALRWGLAEPAGGCGDEAAEGEPSRREIGLRLAGALWWFWHYRSYWTEGRAWLEQALARIAERPPNHSATVARRTQALVLLAAGHFAWRQHDLAPGVRRLEESQALWRELGDPRGLAYATLFLVNPLAAGGDRPRAVALGQESVAAFDELDDLWGRGQSRYSLAESLLEPGTEAMAERLFEEGLAFFRQLGDRWRIAWGLLHLGGVARHLDERAKARSLYEEGLTALRAVGNLWSIGFALDGLAPLAIDEQEYAAARHLYEESVCIWQELGHRERSAQSLYGLARVAQLQGDGDTAASCYQQALILFQEMRDVRGAAECRERLAEIAVKPSMP